MQNWEVFSLLRNNDYSDNKKGLCVYINNLMLSLAIHGGYKGGDIAEKNTPSALAYYIQNPC